MGPKFLSQPWGGASAFLLAEPLIGHRKHLDGARFSFHKRLRGTSSSDSFVDSCCLARNLQGT